MQGFAIVGVMTDAQNVTATGSLKEPQGPSSSPPRPPHNYQAPSFHTTPHTQRNLPLHSTRAFHTALTYKPTTTKPTIIGNSITDKHLSSHDPHTTFNMADTYNHNPNPTLSEKVSDATQSVLDGEVRTAPVSAPSSRPLRK